jgi:outer membrane protein
VARLYYDLVSLTENLEVKRQSLAAVREFYTSEAAQARQGTIPEIELTRAEALLAATELDEVEAEGLVRQQQTILRSELWRPGVTKSVFEQSSIVPADRISIPASDEPESTDDLVQYALSHRPDIAQSTLQVQGARISANASRNATRMAVDLVANYQTRGSIVSSSGTVALDLGRVMQTGIQFELPVRNRVAEADLSRDLLHVRQSEARSQRVAMQVREEVESSAIALQTARSGLNAAYRSRKYREALLEAERAKLSVGASTNLAVLEQETAIAQARATEIVARSSWIKARLALDRVTGELLEKNGILSSLLNDSEVAALSRPESNAKDQNR